MEPIVMAKLPNESVELLELGMIDWPALYVSGSKPPMICPYVASLGVSSMIVTQVVLPKPEFSLRPSIVGVAVVTIGVPPAAVPVLSLAVSATVVGNSIGARLMANSPSP